MKSWYSLPPSPPLLSMKFFDTRNFVKHRRSPLRSFSVLWDNRFSIENRDIPLLGIKFFDTWNFLTQGFLYEMIRYWDKTSETQKGSSTKFFGTVRQQFFYRKSWYSPLIHKIFRYQNFLPTKFFGTLEQQIFYRKSWYSPLIHKIFRYQNFLPTKFFGTLEQQIFYGKSWYSLLKHKIFRYVKLSETQKGSSTNWFGTVRRQKFWHKIVILPPSSSPPPLIHKLFRYQKFCETQKVSPTKFFRYSETTDFL